MAEFVQALLHHALQHFEAVFARLRRECRVNEFRRFLEGGTGGFDLSTFAVSKPRRLHQCDWSPL
jgi:hypothetical protein